MNYTRVTITSFGYELPPHVVTSDDLEKKLIPLYQALHLPKGQLAAITGIHERRWWPSGFPMKEGAILAGRQALAAAGSTIQASDVGMLIYGGVCRDHLEPATACAVAHGLGLCGDTHIYDVSNACLGVLNGMVQVANAIELGQIRAGLVVSCESARQIVESTMDRLLANRDMDTLKRCIATLTGGSGAVAVLLADATCFPAGHRLMGGAAMSAPEHHGLCTWGPNTDLPTDCSLVMDTDSVGVLKNGVALGTRTFAAFMEKMGWPPGKPDKVICHQVGSVHQNTILEAIGLPKEKDFTTFPFLGNIGTVSLPITAAIAHEREFLLPGDKVGFLGIGSGLNCLMLGIEWT
jgi:3-oxoacyl-[acyl-carrier-protein] synthase-3